MVASRSAAKITELEAVLARCPRDRRSLVIQEVIKILLAQPKHGTSELGPFDDVLACLIRQSELSDIASLGAAIATSGLMLPRAVRQLAFAEDAAIADPVLRQASCISSKDLEELADTRGPQLLVAIASRAALPESVTTRLVMRGNEAVHMTLAGNPGARLTEKSFAVLLKLAERNENLARALGGRADCPATPVRKFLALVTGRPRAAFLEAAQPGRRIPLEPEPAPQIAKPRDYAAAEKEVQALARSGQLSDSTINRFAVAKDQERLTASLSLLSQGPIVTVERMLAGNRLDGIVMLCKAARLRWATAASIIRSTVHGAAAAETDLDELKNLFDTLSLSEAQWTVRFGQA